MSLIFFFNDTATTEIYTLSLHDALPIFASGVLLQVVVQALRELLRPGKIVMIVDVSDGADGIDNEPIVVHIEHGARVGVRSEEHTSELQSRQYLVCRLLLEKKK